MSKYELSKFMPPPDPEYICGICLDVLDTPIQTPCHHRFCLVCISKAIDECKKCPLCRHGCRIKKCKKLPQDVENQINQLTMRCDNFDKGCTDLILKEFFLDHCEICDFIMVRCRHKNCGQFMLRKDRRDHEMNTCAFRDCMDDIGYGLNILNASSHNECTVSSTNVAKVLFAIQKIQNKYGSTIAEISDVLISEKLMAGYIVPAHVARACERLKAEGVLGKTHRTNRYWIA